MRASEKKTRRYRNLAPRNPQTWFRDSLVLEEEGEGREGEDKEGRVQSRKSFADSLNASRCYTAATHADVPYKRGAARALET